MFHNRFRILTSLLILWQLLLTLSASWLHPCAVELCAAAGCGDDTSASDSNHAGSSTSVVSRLCRCELHRASSGVNGSKKSTEEHSPGQKKHDCSNCAICQAIFAPRLLVAMVEVATSDQFISALPVPDCADPMLGFGLPTQCRAPPCC